MAAYRFVAETHDLTVPTEEQIMQYMGKSLREIFEGVFPGQDADVLMQTNNGYVLREMVNTPAFEGIQELLEGLQADGWTLAVVTGGNHKVQDVLEHHGIAKYFASVVHSERIAKQKPDPEGILLALQECGVSPEQAIMVGDMRYDITAGKNAGVAATVGLTHGFGTRAELETAGADYVVDSLGAVPAVIQKIEHS